jgi:hypothetical protein
VREYAERVPYTVYNNLECFHDARHLHVDRHDAVLLGMFTFATFLRDGRLRPSRRRR